MPNRIDLPKDPNLAVKVIETEHASRVAEMGWIGKCFGGAQEKPGNIAALAIVASILMIAALAILAPDGAQTNTLYTLFGGVITLALGYVFGRGGLS